MLRRIALARELEFVGVGRQGETLKLVSATRMHDGSRLLVEAGGEKHYVPLPLVGEFQMSNALVAAGLAIATGVDACGRARRARRPEGRERTAGARRRASERRPGLRRLRAHARRARQCAEGAPAARGGQARRRVRRGRRPRSRQAAADGRGGARERRPPDRDGRQSAQRRPRRDPQGGARRSARRRGDRRPARGDPKLPSRGCRQGDILLIAGKGHETGQTVGDKVLPFSDQEEARACAAGRTEAAA